MFGMFLKRYMKAFMDNMGEVAKLEAPEATDGKAQLPDGKTHISRGAF